MYFSNYKIKTSQCMSTNVSWILKWSMLFNSLQKTFLNVIISDFYFYSKL